MLCSHCSCTFTPFISIMWWCETKAAWRVYEHGRNPPQPINILVLYIYIYIERMWWWLLLFFIFNSLNMIHLSTEGPKLCIFILGITPWFCETAQHEFAGSEGWVNYGKMVCYEILKHCKVQQTIHLPAHSRQVLVIL